MAVGAGGDQGLAGRFADVRAAVGRACAAVGRDPGAVRLLPVSKGRPVAVLRDAVGLGCAALAENRVQEMAAKAAELPGVEWVLIGQLQLNKVAKACALAREIQSLDRLELAQAIDRWYSRHRLEGRLPVLVEVNASGESTKAGLPADQVMGFTRALRAYRHLDVRGLMTVAHPDPGLADGCFRQLAELRERLRDRDGQGWDELSMGMSGDFAAAIAHGSTCVRIGTALFGERSA